MRRTVLLAVLSFLLLSMQHEGLVHPFEHLRARSQHTALALPHADDGCVECALLAAGMATTFGGHPAIAAVVPPVQFVSAAFVFRAADFPASFSSRAPPVLL